MACLADTNATIVAISLVSLLGLGAACGPTVELETGSGSASGTGPDDGGSTTTTTTTGDTTIAVDESTTFEDGIPDWGLPAASLCPEGWSDLEVLWTVSVSGPDRADAVAVGEDRVAWTAGTWGDSAVRVLDLDGNPLWEQPVPLAGGEGDLSLEDLAVAPSGEVVLAGTPGGDFDALLVWFDPAGNVLFDDLFAGPDFDMWQGVALLPEGDAVVAGQTGEELHVRRYSPAGAVAWSQTFAQPGAQVWGSHVAVAPDGTIYVSGHVNAIPGPVLLAYDPAGSLLWSHLDDGSSGTLDVASSVAADSEGRALLAINSYDTDSGRVERYDASGVLDVTVPLDFPAVAITTDVDDSMIVGGTTADGSAMVVERRFESSGFMARHEQPGRWFTGVAVDQDCHAYAVGFGPGTDPTLVKLR